MANFKLYYPILQKNEGGYANNPNDSGGQTWAGIARNFNPSWAGWKIIDKTISELKVKYAKGWPAGGLVPALNKALRANLQLADMVYQFYKVNYWNCLQLDFVNSQPLAEQMADMGINAGAMRPAKMIQWIIYNQDKNYHLVIDGDIGPASIKAINELPARDLYRIFVDLRKAFYYFRVGHVDKVTEVQRAFFTSQLNLRSKPDQIEFLAGWLKRCMPATI